jgi:hypothetical protein
VRRQVALALKLNGWKGLAGQRSSLPLLRELAHNLRSIPSGTYPWLAPSRRYLVENLARSAGDQLPPSPVSSGLSSGWVMTLER